MTLPLAFDSRGAGGMPVIFAHSFAGDLSHWSATLDYLKPQRRVIAFDFSGHGNSPGAVGRYSYGELAKDIGAVAESAQLASFVLVGHSMGAAIAIEFAAAHVQHVQRLVLVDPPPSAAIPPGQLEQMHQALEQDPYAFIEQYWNQQLFTDARVEVKQRLLASLRKLSRAAAIDLTKEAFAVDSSVALRRYPAPKFAIVRSANDGPLSLHNAVPGVQHQVIDGTGHWIHLDKPDEFNKTLERILNSI
jgi:esterase